MNKFFLIEPPTVWRSHLQERFCQSNLQGLSDQQTAYNRGQGESRKSGDIFMLSKLDFLAQTMSNIETCLVLVQ